MKTLLEQKLLQKVLNHKFDETNEASVDRALDCGHPELTNVKLKNICFYVHPELAKELEDMLHILKMSKRDFITSAVEDALVKANSIASEYGILPKYIQLTDVDGFDLKPGDILEKHGERYVKVVDVPETSQGELLQ